MTEKSDRAHYLFQRNLFKQVCHPCSLKWHLRKPQEEQWPWLWFYCGCCLTFACFICLLFFDQLKYSVLGNVSKKTKHSSSKISPSSVPFVLLCFRSNFLELKLPHLQNWLAGENTSTVTPCRAAEMYCKTPQLRTFVRFLSKEALRFTCVSLSPPSQCVLVTYGVFAVTAAAYLMHRQRRKKLVSSSTAWAHADDDQKRFPINKYLNLWCCLRLWSLFWL